jgi:ABC-type multidrug transport system fused ATPase/permease subunit
MRVDSWVVSLQKRAIVYCTELYRYYFETMSLTPDLLNCVTEAAQALSAVERITRFLNRELRKEQVPTSKDTGTEMQEANAESEGPVDADTPLRLVNASFLLGGSPAKPVSSSEEVGDCESGAVFKVSDITISVQKGEVLAVCGPVGCGKKYKGCCSSCVATITITNTVCIVATEPAFR